MLSPPPTPRSCDLLPWLPCPPPPTLPRVPAARTARFLCALAALAERPENVYKLFIDDDAAPSSSGGRGIVSANPEGVYKMR